MLHNITRWLSEDALLLKNARTEKRLDTRCEPARTLDVHEDRLLDTLADRATEDDFK